jgi:hypothetical protein
VDSTEVRWEILTPEISERASSELCELKGIVAVLLTNVNSQLLFALERESGYSPRVIRELILVVDG